MLWYHFLFAVMHVYLSLLVVFPLKQEKPVSSMRHNKSTTNALELEGLDSLDDMQMNSAWRELQWVKLLWVEQADGWWAVDQ